MVLVARLFIVFLAMSSSAIYRNYKKISQPLPIPEIDENQYWGPGAQSAYKEDSSIKSFSLKYEDAIAELKQELSRPLKLHDPLEEVDFEYGFNSKALEKIITYWRDNYLTRWAEREKFLNKFPHFMTQIQGLNIHYLHVKPTKPGTKKVLPLILLHGWPGSIREFYEMIPLLTTPNSKSDFVFEVIAPSLPGYGWSQSSSKKGLGPAQIAVIFRNLMLRLGHEKFLIQGGDWGSIIGNDIATLFPDNSIGYHSNLCLNKSPISIIKKVISSFFPSYFHKKEHEEFFVPAMKSVLFNIEESGYSHIQATKPDTIGTALSGNPVGLAAYILEKFSTWTNPEFRQLEDGGLEKKFDLDALLDNVMIYYLTNSITTSQRLYSEMFNKAQIALNLDRVPTKVPTGCARFKYDLMQSSDWELKDKFTNLVTSTYYLNGGHFAALELPNVLYEDFVAYVEQIGL